jgi:hypothetical protein
MGIMSLNLKAHLWKGIGTYLPTYLPTIMVGTLYNIRPKKCDLKL